MSGCFTLQLAVDGNTILPHCCDLLLQVNFPNVKCRVCGNEYPMVDVTNAVQLSRGQRPSSETRVAKSVAFVQILEAEKRRAD